MKRNKPYFCPGNVGERIDNIPDSGTMTGYLFTDHHGCWHEYRTDEAKDLRWIIGDYPEEHK